MITQSDASLMLSLFYQLQFDGHTILPSKAITEELLGEPTMFSSCSYHHNHGISMATASCTFNSLHHLFVLRTRLTKAKWHLGNSERVDVCNRVPSCGYPIDDVDLKHCSLTNPNTIVLPDQANLLLLQMFRGCIAAKQHRFHYLKLYCQRFPFRARFPTLRCSRTDVNAKFL